MNIFNHYRQKLLGAIEDLRRAEGWPEFVNLDKVTMEPPRDQSHGDMSTNAAMILSKQVGLPPLDFAEKLANAAPAKIPVEKCHAVKPGFVNFTLPKMAWQSQLAEILANGLEYGNSDIGKDYAINVEFCSANPTGPIHVGHGRGTVIGDALVHLLRKTGYFVTGEYYINDAGGQIDTVTRTVYLRYREALGENIGEIPAGLYPGEYLIDVGQALAKRDGKKWIGAEEPVWLEAIRQFTMDAMMAIIKDDLNALGVRHDIFTSERAVLNSGAVESMLQTLEDNGHIYIGVLDPPKGKAPDDWEPRPQTLFRATQFGDDTDRPLKKADGSYAYFAKDIAYHYDKFLRLDKNKKRVLIDILGADHGGYVKRMGAAVKAFAGEQAEADIKICQMIKFVKNGQPVKMSKRAGNFLTLRDVIDEVGKDVYRFIIMTRKPDMAFDFDYDKVKEQSKDNPVFYVQYAHARICSVMRHAAEMFGADTIGLQNLATADFSLLTDSDELALIRLMAAWPRAIEAAAYAHEPHRLCFFIQELAAAFHSLWNKGKDHSELRFLIEDDKNLSLARLAMIESCRLIIASGLAVFGVEPVKEMQS